MRQQRQLKAALFAFRKHRLHVLDTTIEIEGPESHVRAVEAIPTTVNVRGRQSTFREAAELDISDPLIRIPKPAAVTVEVRIRPQSK